MANLNYYAHEINDLLRQVVINRNDIGMTQINALPVHEGELEILTKPAGYPEDVITVTGSRFNGNVSIDIDGTISTYASGDATYLISQLSRTGNGEDDEGVINPGVYIASMSKVITGSSFPFDVNHPPTLDIQVNHDDTFTTYSVFGSNTVEVTIPETYTEVIIKLTTNLDTFSGTAHCDLYPFLRLKELEAESFEPYKPDLQTQINECTSTVYSAIGYIPSVNLFPIDKGSRAEPLIINGNNGVFYIAKGDSPSYPSFIQFNATSTETEYEQEEIYNIRFNDGYDFNDDHLYGDLMPGEYLFSFNVDFDRHNFNTHGKFSYKIYASETSISEWELVAICEEGQTVSFSVTKEKPFICISAVAQKYANQSWDGDYIIMYPFLRRRSQNSNINDIYIPSLNKQINELRAMIEAGGGYNETQTETAYDYVSEVNS